MKIADRPTAWLTGAGSGLGRAIAVGLSRAGYDLILTGRRMDALEETAALVGEVDHAPPVLRALDVSKAQDVSGFGHWLDANRIPLDVVVCSAGSNVRRRRWHELAMADFASVVDTNLTGVARCASVAINHMRRGRGGTIVVISSWIAWRNDQVAGPAYAASKKALGALVESINMEEGASGIRATHLCPGEVVTPILLTRPTPLDSDALSKMLQPEDVSTLVTTIASLPPHVCVNELVVSHVANRMYTGQ